MNTAATMRALAFQPVKSNPVLPRRSSSRKYVGPISFLSFGNIQSKTKKSSSKRPTVIPEPSYNIPIVLLGVAGASHLVGNEAAAGISGLLGVFLAVQASRVRFIFDDEGLEVVIGKAQEKTENAFVGGDNRWSYDSFINWEFWWPGFPVLVYFKERQTKEEGQIHFFPLIFNGKQVYDVMVERCGPSMGSGPRSGK